jgi:lactate permease
MQAAITWSQNYAPLGAIGISALVAALPVVTLLVLLGFLHVRAHLAALSGLGLACAIALVVYHMPGPLVLAAAGYGAAFGLFPIGWIVLNAIFIYNISVETGGFAVLQRQVAGFSGDRRIQALLIAFSFGAFIEGFAGFGTPVAITGALLIGLGFRPLEAAKLALIGNTAPVAYGSVGIPIITLAKVTGLDINALSSMVGRLLPFFSFIVPFWLIAAQAGWRGMLGVWPACLVTGASFAIAQFLISNFHGPWIVDCVSAMCSIGALLLLSRFWQPARVETAGQAELKTHEQTEIGGSSNTKVVALAESSVSRGVPQAREHAVCLLSSRETPGGAVQAAACQQHSTEPEAEEDPQSVVSGPWSTSASKLHAWLPWIFLTVLVFLVCLPVVKTALNSIFAPKLAVPGLHLAVLKVPPVVPAPEREPAEFSFNILSATGTALLAAGLLTGLCLGLRPRQLLRIYGRTLARVRISLLTIALMLALGFTTRFCGSDTTMGLAVAATGGLFPFFSPILGWLGVALTGSDTSSNVLFGNLQQVTARQIGVSPILTAAANSAGGVMGKMIDAQSIVVASVATGGHPESPDAGTILRVVFWHSLALAVLMGCLVMLQAHFGQWLIPK